MMVIFLLSYRKASHCRRFFYFSVWENIAYLSILLFHDWLGSVLFFLSKIKKASNSCVVLFDVYAKY